MPEFITGPMPIHDLVLIVQNSRSWTFTRYFLTGWNHTHWNHWGQ